MSDYTILNFLGDGGFASVFLVQHSTFGKVAFKKLGATNLPDTDVIRLKREAEIHLRIRHPNIVSIFEAQFTSPDIGLFLEYMQYGSVDVFIREYTVTWEWKTQILYDVSLAMSYLHQQKPALIHGDLKSQNVLIGDGYRAKISDFGLSRTMQTLSCSTIDRKLSGTLEFIAPEYLEDPFKKKTEKFDVYGFAITAWEIYSRKSFFKSFTDGKLLGVHVQNGTRPRLEDIREDIPSTILDLVKDCWHHQEHERPVFGTIREILFNQLSSNQIELNVPQMKKIASHDLDESYPPLSYRSDCDEPDSFPASFGVEMLEHSRAKEKFITGFRRVINSLLEYLDPFNGLLRSLKKKKVLTDTEYEQLMNSCPNETNSLIAMNKELLFEYILPKIEFCSMQFVEALKDSDQSHIVNFIMNAGEHMDRVLSKDELRIIDDNMSCLVNLIDPYEMGLLDLLVSTKCITCRHLEVIEKRESNQEKITELLKILKSRNYKHFANFKSCLRNTNQGRIADVLEQGSIITVEVKLSERKHKNRLPSELAELVSKYSNEINFDNYRQDGRNTSRNEFEEIGIKMGIQLVGSHYSCEAENTIVNYFQCTTDRSREQLKHMYETGHLKKVLESEYRSLLEMSGNKARLIKQIHMRQTDEVSVDNCKGRSLLHHLSASKHRTRWFCILGVAAMLTLIVFATLTGVIAGVIQRPSIEVDGCSCNPCQNGGKYCTDKGNTSFCTCSCPLGFEGQFCENRYCEVDLRSYSYGNIVPSESFGYIKINNRTFLEGDMSEAYFLHPDVTNFRGINTMEFDFDTCSASNWKWFDTCSHRPTYYNNSLRCSGETIEFIEYFTTHVSNGTVLLAVTMDDPMLNLNQSFPMLMDEGIDVREYPARSMFAFVMQKGAKDKTVLVKSGPQLRGITMSVRISKTVDTNGSMVYNFRRLDPHN